MTYDEAHEIFLWLTGVVALFSTSSMGKRSRSGVFALDPRGDGLGETALGERMPSISSSKVPDIFLRLRAKRS